MINRGKITFKKTLLPPKNAISVSTHGLCVDCQSLPAQYMPQGRHRMIQHHPLAAPAHHRADTLAHIPAIAVHPASAARRFPVPVRTSVQPLHRVLKQLCAILAHALLCMAFAVTIHPYHDCHRRFLSFNPSPHRIYKKTALHKSKDMKRRSIYSVKSDYLPK